MEVLLLMAQGKPSKEIAVRLSLSTQTVQTHVKNIYRKLNVHNKIEALMKAMPYISGTDRLPANGQPELTANFESVILLESE